MKSQVCALLLLVASGLSAQTAVPAQTHKDVIRGRVTSDSGRAIADADVIVTMAPTREVVSAKSNADGTYELRMERGTGEYLLYVASLERTPFRRRLTGPGRDTTFVVDVVLKSAVTTTLATVRSVATVQRPNRTGSVEPQGRGVTGTDHTAEGVVGQLSPDRATNLEALASTIPGLTVTPEGVSAFGVSGGSIATLNGSAMGVGELPRDAKMSARFQTSPFDPSQGGFAGAQMGFTVPAGTVLNYRRSSLAFDAPNMIPGQRGPMAVAPNSVGLTAGYGADGPAFGEKFTYNSAVQFHRVTTPITSLADLDAESLARSGIARDSASRLLSILATNGIPVTTAGIPGGRISSSGSFVARLDRSSGTAAPGPWWILGTASLREDRAPSLSPSSIPASSSVQRGGSVGAQAFVSAYTGPKKLWLNESMLSASASTNRGTPYSSLPSGRVLVSSRLDDGTDAVRYLSFGGSSQSLRHDDRWSAEATNTTTLAFASHPTKPIKLFAQARYEGFDQMPGASRAGVFSFASLADFENGQPSSFTRALNPTERNGGEASGALAVGANWTMKKVNLVGGVRADANAFTNAPTLNPAAQSTFGLSNDHVPNTVALSPRLGFSWTYRGPNGASFAGSRSGSAWRGPTVIRGGIGRFRARLAPDLIAPAIGTTGLSGAADLICTGSDVPTPNWTAYALDVGNIPDSCPAGSTGTADPDVYAFARGYAPQDAWRSTLGSTRTFRNTLHVAVDAVYSITRGVPSSVDRNFSGASAFTLGDEGGRPVYSSNLTTTGVVSPVGSRYSPSFGRVIERRSDMRTTARQLVVRTVPNISWADPFLSVDYVYSDTRLRRRGFDATTAGDPRSVGESPEAYTPTHRFVLQTGKVMGSFIVSAFTSVQSGVRFTPLVASDINGDGLANDRAFVFANPAVQSLIASGPKSARECLAAAVGSVAGENSCSAPWTTSMNARIAYWRGLPGVGSRATVALNIANPLAALDYAFHGQDGLRGWGSNANPDPYLLYVRGYDAAQQRFIYDVNSRFGSTSPRSATLANPFRLTLDVRMDVGESVERQQVKRNLRVTGGAVGSRANVDTIRMRFLTTGAMNAPQDIYGHILYFKDSLALSASQIAYLENARKPFRAVIDSMYTELASYLAALPPVYDAGEPARRIRETSDAAWRVMHGEGRTITAVLSPAQLHLLAPPIVATLTRPYTGAHWYGAFGARWR
jgi:hypothetical protein